ncbi:LysR substrate-binding domain-containing protein, partial [Staphylococcus aureus]|nr:LysR substrate-binding domain-containing protein [Staphylococcus aureus]
MSPDELLQSPFIMREKGTRIRAKINSWFKRHSANTAPQNRVTLSNLEATKRLIGSGYGVTVIPHLAISDELNSGEL